MGEHRPDLQRGRRAGEHEALRRVAAQDRQIYVLGGNDLTTGAYVSQQDVSFTGNAQLKIHTLANTTGARRVAHVLVGGRVVVTVTQD